MRVCVYFFLFILFFVRWMFLCLLISVFRYLCTVCFLARVFLYAGTRIGVHFDLCAGSSRGAQGPPTLCHLVSTRAPLAIGPLSARNEL